MRFGLFARVYAGLAEACRRAHEPGLVVVAVDEHTATPAGVLRMTARDHHVAAIVGRHPRCDLVLPSLSSRQLAIVVEPVRGNGVATGRILDLCSHRGF